MLADNPRPEEYDDTWPEPEQATWVTLGLALMKADGTPVKAEFLRPREWVERLGLSVGGLLPVGVSELDIDCEAVVTSITPCPEIAQGEGRVVTGRFVTRDAVNLVTVALENGAAIRATNIHPVWSVDREEWVPAGDLEPGELVDTLAGPVAVLSVDRLESALDVYNIEVHGEHVFRVTADGVLVHNNYLRANMIAAYGADFMKGKQAAHIIPQNGWLWSPSALKDIIKRVKDAGLMDDVANGFASTAGHQGTHTRKYVDQLIETMEDRFTRDDLLAGITELRKKIEAGVFE